MLACLALLRCHCFDPPIVLVIGSSICPGNFMLQTGKQAAGVTSVSWRTGPGSDRAERADLSAGRDSGHGDWVSALNPVGGG